jgi:RHH-type proline utilization regulon transcriptional repressor/proline dehydrogenase/delta 1-pyrroline-5-carboxylate dehydrogenase
MFGTHNAYTVCAILDMAGDNRDGFEFQRLFGMGETLYDKILGVEKVPVRIYAPVGVHRDLLPYLVRRLLENGANSSFVNKVFDAGVPPSDLAFDVFDRADRQKYMPHPSIPLPCDIYDGRLNALGLDLDDEPTLQGILTGIEKAHDRREIICASIIGGHAEKSGNSVEITNPADEKDVMGTCYMASADTVSRAFTLAQNAWPAWNKTPARGRAEILNKIADMYEERMPELMALCIHESGKTIPDAMAEVREAIDFCRYYAALGTADFDADGVLLKSYTGESNRIRLEGRGVFVCISPWNFPLAIFTGQVVAALMAGNCVLAKPAEQTPFVAQRTVNLMHKAGVPEDVLHLITGDGRVGEMMTSHPHVAGVAFTGSTQAAQSINRTLAGKDGAIVPLIAETGGQNAMIADSSALPEQVVDDVMVSAFGSAGQRCSAARILFVQEDIADKVIAMLKGAMQTLRVGNPQYYATDIGPVIDEEAMANLQHHKSTLEALGKFIAQVPLAEDLARTGHYFAPVAYEIPDISLLTKEVFGPVLHVVRFAGGNIPALINDLNKTGYGLTFGVHTRIDSVAKACTEQVMAGNVYINRSMIGAVVGVQPFGGQGLSGTGPKAGGPHYLQRFATEKTVSVNTTASGGNTSLVMLSE